MGPTMLQLSDCRGCSRPLASQHVLVRCQKAAPGELIQTSRRAVRKAAGLDVQAPETAVAAVGRLQESKRALQSLVQQAPWQLGLFTKRGKTDAAALVEEAVTPLDDLADAAAGQDAEPPVGTILPLPRGVWWGRGAAKQPQPVQVAEHVALELVKARWLSGSKPGERRDKFKVGLVVEGGGMRGVVSGGALQAMHDLGMRDAFDAVYGSSAGAINATYFLSGQREGVNIYCEDIANRRFVDLRRLVPRRGELAPTPALDLGFLLDEVMMTSKPLDWDAVLSSPVPLKVVASCLDTLQPVILERFRSATDLSTCLRASANVPEVAGGPVEHRGLRLVDAAVFEPVPFRAAIADACTHVFALCTRPPYMPGRLTKLVDDLMTTTIKRAVMNPAYMHAAWEQEADNIRDFGATPEEMLIAALHPESHTRSYFAGTHVFPAFPGAAASFISPVCTDVSLLEKGQAEGRAMVMRLFAEGVSPPPVPPLPATAAPLAPHLTNLPV